MSMDLPPVDDTVLPGPPPSAHNRTALILVEALIHCLLERSILRVEDALEIVDTALDVSAAIAEDELATHDLAPSAIATLELMKLSLRTYG